MVILFVIVLFLVFVFGPMFAIWIKDRCYIHGLLMLLFLIFCMYFIDYGSFKNSIEVGFENFVLIFLDAILLWYFVYLVVYLVIYARSYLKKYVVLIFYSIVGFVLLLATYWII